MVAPHVIPSKKGIHKPLKRLDSRLHGNDTHATLFTFRLNQQCLFVLILVNNNISYYNKFFRIVNNKITCIFCLSGVF